MCFDRHDICTAYYMYSVLWGGDSCSYENQVQARLHALQYRPSRSEECLPGLSENAKQIYGALVQAHQSEHIAYERLRRRAPGVFPSWPGTANIRSRDPYGHWLASLGLPRDLLRLWSQEARG